MALAASAHTHASSVLASTFGYTTTDATAAFQAAVQSANDTIIIDLQAADWNVGPSEFDDLADKTLIFQPGVVLRALPGAFNATNACLLKLIRCTNITIIGYGAEFVMNKAEYVLLNDSEYRHTLQLGNCSIIRVKGLTLRDSGGDGIMVGGADWWGGPLLWSEYIVLEDVRCINHYRQGMSITSVYDMVVRNCLFTGTNGTLPESGVDIEPFEPYQRVQSLLFQQCSFTENDHCGIQVALWELDSTSLPVSIAFTDCFTSHNGRPGHPYGPVEIDITSDADTIGGLVVFTRCHVDSSDWTAVNVRKPAAAFDVLFSDCAFTNVSQQQVPYNTPIWVEVQNYVDPCAPFGGVLFNSCLVTYNTNFPFLQCNGWSTSPGPQGVSFTGKVVGPNVQDLNITNSMDTINCVFNQSLLSALPATEVTLSLDVLIAQECDPDEFIFSVERNSTDYSFPLPVRYDTSGTATYGDDLHLLPGSLMIVHGGTAASDLYLARPDGITEPTEYAVITPLASPLYTLSSPLSIAPQLVDCLGTGVEDVGLEKEIVAWPNPFTETFSLSGLPSSTPITVHNAMGQVIHQGRIDDPAGVGWPAGVYRVSVAPFNSGPITVVKQ